MRLLAALLVTMAAGCRNTPEPGPSGYNVDANVPEATCPAGERAYVQTADGALFHVEVEGPTSTLVPCEHPWPGGE